MFQGRNRVRSRGALALSALSSSVRGIAAGCNALRRASAVLLTLILAALSLPALATQTINGITINENLPQARRGVAYTYTIPISGGTAPYTVTILNGATLPQHLTVSSAGVVSGVLSCTAGNGNNGQDIRVVDSSAAPIVADFIGNKGLSVNVTAGPAGTCVTLTINPASLPSPAVGVAYNQSIVASGGLAPYTYSVSAGALPAGLTLNAATGQITGTPTASGAFSFTISVIDAADSTGTRSYSGTTLAALVLNPASLPATTQNVAYSQTVTASGGTGPYTYAPVGALPTGLLLNTATGAITGTPTVAGTSSFSVTATDSLGAFGSRAYSIVVNPALSIAPASLPASTQGVAYNQTVTASGGTGTKTYAVSSGALPTGLALNASTGAITGTSSAAGTFAFTVTATDGVGASGSKPYSVTINPAITVNPATLPATTVGLAYNQSVSVTGGTGTMSYSVTAGSLPAGLSLNVSTGAVTGTSSAAGTSNFTITATDAVGATGLRAYSLMVNAALVLTPASLPAPNVGTPYNQTVSATGGTGTVAYSVSAGSLPAGLSLNSATGAITGTPTASGPFNFTITATDTLGATASVAYSFTVGAVTLNVNPASLPNWTQGLAYSQAVTASGGTGPYTYGPSGTLPTGLTLNPATGAIAGTPSAAGAFTFSVGATDSLGSTGSRSYTITIAAALNIAPATLPATTQGVAYNQSVTVSGGTGAITYSVSLGSLPAGLSLNAATGAITGTSTTAATANFTITATDAVGATTSKSYSVTVNAPLSVNPASLPAPSVGTSYSQTVSVTGGTGAATFAVSAGTLPAGLSLNAGTGAITGTPTTAGAANFTISATDTVGASASRAYSFTVTAVTLAVSPASLPATTQGLTYSQTITATGGTAPYTYALTGTLPTGLALDASTGAITGTSSAAGTFNFTITATDNIGSTGNRVYTVVVNAVISISPASLPGTTQGVAYSQSVTASGGTGSITYAVSAGALPAGLNLNGSSGAITGTATSSGTANFTITATDSLGANGSRAYSVTVGAPIAVNPATLPASTQGVAYSQSLSSTGGTGAVTYAVTAGAVPTGLSLSSAGGLTGTPTVAGTSNFTVTATDSVGATGSRAYSVVINAALAVSPSSLPAASLGVAYSRTVSATGGTGAPTYSISAGALPTGLSLSSTSGAINGTPSSGGAFSFTVTATDTVGATASQAYSVNVNSAITVNPASLPATTVSAAFSQTLTASGGNGSYTFSVTAGSLPAGLALAGAGGLTGSPSTAGTFNFTVTATDGLGATGARAYSVVVNASMTVNPATLPATTINVPYSQTISAAGGTAPVAFSVAVGTLPTGLALSSAGVLSGTPSAAGTFNFTVAATDSVGVIVTRPYTITVAPPIVVNPASLPTATAGTAYSQSLSTAGGTGVTTFAVTAGAMPSGLVLSAAGALTGTPSANGLFNFTITATDTVGATGSRAYTLTVNPGVVVNPVSLPATTLGVTYSQAVSAIGGNGSYSYSVTAGALPAGVSLNAVTGALSGTTAGAGAANFTITATDGLGTSGSRAYTVVVNPALTISPATLPNGSAGAAYSQAVNATGGTGAVSFAVSAGALPTGLTLNTTSGTISGTPSASGTSSFTITGTDTVGATGTRAYSVTINAAIAVNPAALPAGVVGTVYSQGVTASGGNGSYTFSVTAGSLPAGLTLNAASGAITGTPSTAASSNFTVTATDGLGAIGSRAYSVTINTAMTLNPATLPGGAVGTPYSQTVSATGGSGTYSFSITAGSLPAGLALNASTGAIAGTPTAAGTATFTITAADGLGASASRAYSVTINAAMTLTPATLPVGMVPNAYAQSLSASGGSGTYTYAVSVGSLPPGFTLNGSTGLLAGTPSAAGASTFSITVTDSLGATATRSYTLTFNAAVTVGPVTLASPTVGSAYSQTINGSGGTGTYAFGISAGSLPTGLALTTGTAATARAAVTAGSLPRGMALNAATGVISGTPTSAGTWSFTITATDDLGFSGSRAYTLTVVMPALTLTSAVVNGAVGSPYSSAIAVSGGSAPYSFAVSSGQLPAGLVLDTSTGALTGVPTAPGSYTFTITATDANGASGSFVVTMDVAARPDPTQDPAVRGINVAQISAASRFGTAQIGNLTARMQMLHLGHDPCAVNLDIGTNVRWERTESATSDKSNAKAETAKSDKKGCDRAYAVWAGGNVDFGFLRPSSAINRSDFRTEGVTLGADRKLGEDLIVGAAVGYGRDETEVDAAGSESRSQARTIALYGSYRPTKSVYIDGVLGYGGLSFDLQRWQSDDRVLLSADRGGSQWFGSVAAGAVMQSQGMKLSPYARYDHVQSRLDAYDETGTSGARLNYDALSFTEDTLALGVYAGFSIKVGSTTIEPGLRLEQRRVRSGTANQGMTYWDAPAMGYTLSQAAESDDRTSGALSVMLRFGQAASLGFEYSYTGSDTFRNESIRAILRAPF